MIWDTSIWETRVLEPLENPFGPKVLPMSQVRCVTHVSGPDRGLVARPVRFELTTPCSGGMYSIHLSYGRAVIENCLTYLF